MTFTYPAAMLALTLASPAPAQDPPGPQSASTRPITIAGSVAILTDYRLRGVSQSDRDPAVQGTLTAAHESGFYIATFASNLAGWGKYGDWQLGADYAIRGTPLTVAVSWIDTDIARREAAYLQPGFSKGQDGRGAIAGGTLVAALTAAF